MSRTSHALLALCFFLSGATSLVLEVAWAKELTYALGNSIHATSTVIAAFMAGLGIGSIAAGRPLFARFAPIKTYALLQLLIGITGFFSIAVLRSTDPVFSFIYQDFEVGPNLFLLLRFAVVFPLMAAPATLMGMSLPLVVEARSREMPGVAANAGMIYGLNTLGAVTGTYVAGFVLIPLLGLSGTCMAIGIVDFCLGLALFVLHRANLQHVTSPDDQLPTSSSDTASSAHGESPLKTPMPTRHHKRLLALVFCGSGFLAMVYEVAWFRLLANVLGGTVHSFTSMLGVYLIGVGLGSVLGARLIPKRGSPLAAVAVGLFVIGICAVSSLMLANSLPARYATLFWAFNGGTSLAGYVIAQALTAAIVVLPTSLAMGVLFPLVLRAYENLGRDAQDRQDASEIYALNTFGGICGSLATGFFFLPLFGLTPTLLVAAGTSAILAVFVLAVLMHSETATPRMATAALGLSLTAVMAFLMPSMNHLELHRGVFYQMQASREKSQIDLTKTPGYRLFYYREGLHGSLSITGDEDLALRLSGKPVATTEFHDRVHLALLGHLPALFAREARDVAVVGLGMGVALDALVTHPEIESLEVAELEPSVIEVQSYFESVNRDSLSDPRVDLILEDGRTHLTYSEKMYDIITSDPISPIIAGAANLYTEDFYQLSAERLKPGGVFCQWWEMSGISEVTYKNVLATMRSVFPHVRVFVYGVDSMVIGSMDPIEISWPEFKRRFNVPAVQADLAFYNLDSPLHVLGLLWADTELVDRYVVDHEQRNTDDNAWLEHQMPIDHYQPHKGKPIPNRMARVIAEGRLQAIEKTVPGIPRAALVEHIVRHPPTKSSSVHDSQLPAIRKYLGSEGLQPLLADLPTWHTERRTPSKELRDFLTLERAYERAMRSGDPEAAEIQLRAMTAFPQLPITYFWNMKRVELLTEQGRDREALDLLGDMRRRTPSRTALYERGQELAKKLGETARARRDSDDLARMQPIDHPESTSQEGTASLRARDLIFWADDLEKNGHFVDSVRHARNALELDPDNPSAQAILAKSLLRLGRPADALAEYQSLLKRNPDSSRFHIQIASVLMQMGKKQEALDSLARASELDPESGTIPLRTAQVLLAMKRIPEAEAQFKKSLDLAPRSAQAHVTWASLLRRQGKMEEAVRHLETALEIDPGNPRYEKLLKETRAKWIRRPADRQ